MANLIVGDVNVTLQRLLGHSDLSTVLGYLDLVQDDLRRAHNQYGVVDRALGAEEEA